jgi:hypothetical protein
MFDHPSNALSMARRHQGELLQKEQMDQLARKVNPRERRVPDRFAAALHWLTLLRPRGRVSLGKRARQPDFRHQPQP